MLDINGIKEKINEVTQLAESSHNQTAISLFNMLKKDTAMQDIYDGNGGDDFERELLDRCDEYVENEIYRLDKAYQDIDWIRVNGLYFNWEEIWSDWKDFCENIELKKPENNGEKYNECLNENVDIEETGLKPLDDFVKAYEKIKADSFMDRNACSGFMDYFNKCLKALKISEQESDHLFSIISDIGIEYGRNYTIMSDVDEDFPSTYEYLSDWLDDATQRGLMYYMNEEGRKKYADYTYNLIKDYINENPNVLGKYGNYDEPDKIDDIKKDGSEYNDELAESKHVSKATYYRNKCKKIFQKAYFSVSNSSLVFMIEITEFIDSMKIDDYDKNKLKNEILDICIDYAKENTDLDFVRREYGVNYDTINDYVNDVTANDLMYYMNDEKRVDCATDIYNTIIDYINNMDKTYIDEPKNIQNPKSIGDEYLEEQKLMEMSARNYTSFDIEPYIICDTEFVGEGEPTDDEYDYYTPLEDFIDRRNRNYIPRWVTEQEGRDIITFNDFNDDLNTDCVYIIGYSGYYEGMTVGIISRDIDHDLLTDYFEDLYETNENGEDLYRRYNTNEILTQSAAEDYIQKNIIRPELHKARDKIVDIQTEYGGKLYPSYYSIKLGGSGEEFNETKVFNKKPLNEDEEENVWGDVWGEWNPDKLEQDVMNLDESRYYKYKGFDIYIDVEYIDDNEQWYNAYIYKGPKVVKTISESLDGISMESWGLLCDRITDWIDENYHVDDSSNVKTPEDTGEMWTESKKPLTETTINQIINYTLGPGDYINSIHQFGYHIFIDCYDEGDEDDDDYEVYYEVSIYDENNSNSFGDEVLVERERFTSWNNMFHWIRNYFKDELKKEEEKNKYLDEPSKIKKPNSDGDKEFDESVTLTEDFKPWMDEPVPFSEERTVEYNGYDINIEGCVDYDDGENYKYYNLQFYKLGIENDDEARVYETTADTWDDACDKIIDYVDNHPVNPNIDEPKDIKKPKFTGKEFDESVQLTETPSSYRDLPNPWWHDIYMEPNDVITVDYEGYSVFIECAEDDEDEDERFYILRIKNNEDDDALYEGGFTFWNDMVNYLKEYVYKHPLNPNLDEPEISKKPKVSGEEFDESLDINGIKKKINEIVRKADGNN